MDLILKSENSCFIKETGEKIEFKNYFVEYQGIKLYVKPSDKTSKNILDIIVKTEKK